MKRRAPDGPSTVDGLRRATRWKRRCRDRQPAWQRLSEPGDARHPLSTRYFSIRTARNARAAIFSVSLQGGTEARGGAKRLDAFRDDADCGGCWLILYVHEVN